MHSRRFIVAAFILSAAQAFVGAAVWMAPAPQAPARLFVEVPSRGAPEAAARPWTVRARRVAISPDAWDLPRRAATAPRAIIINLFGDTALHAVADRIDEREGVVTWAGRVPGRAHSSVTLSVVGDAMAGSIIMPGAVYSIRYVGGGVHELAEVDQSRFPQEDTPRPAPARSGGSAGSAPAEGPLFDPGAAPQIDVLALYTPAAAAAAGGTSGILARINLGIGETNTSYANSNVAQRLRLVHATQVDYVENAALDTDLDNLTNATGSVTPPLSLADTAALLRDVYGADLVTLITAPPSSTSCGTAWMMSSVDAGFESFAFSVVSEHCISPNASLAHEMGHNMGARHDWYVDNSTAPFTYAHGYANPPGKWRTIMAYNNLCAAQSVNCTRLLYWSNPAVTYAGAPMGIAAGTKSDCPTGNVNTVSCDADDHRALDETAATVASFRTHRRRAASDFVLDFRSDILWRHALNGDVWLWPMEGASRTAESYVRTIADTTWEIRGQGDQTGDGKADLLWRNKVTGQLYFWPMDGATPQDEVYVGAVDTAYDIVGTGDFDGDGQADLLWRHTTLGDVWIWLMNGATPLSQVYIDRVDPAYGVKGVGDLDADGKADIVWQGAAGDVWVWPMSGATRIDQVWVGTVPDTAYQIQGVGDFDGDGQADLVWWHATRGEVWVWTMDGTARQSETWVATVPDTTYRIAAMGDYDGDTKADILWHHATRGEVWVWTMNGTTRLAETWVATVPDIGYRIIR